MGLTLERSPVEYREQLRGRAVNTGFLLKLTLRRLRLRLANLGDSAGQRPTTVVLAPDKQNFAVAKDGGVSSEAETRDREVSFRASSLVGKGIVFQCRH